MLADSAYSVEELGNRGLEPERLPAHVAFIMDGNGRWAQRQSLPRIMGHRQGAETARMIVEEAARLGLRQITLYCLSSENWKRPAEELAMLMQLLAEYLIQERTEIIRQNLQFGMIGRREGLPREVLDELDETQAVAAKNTGMRLCLAINYGGRGEIIDAARRLAAEVVAGRLTTGQIDEAQFANSLDTAGMVDPDLVIRTAGEMRISNFLLWQLSYAELHVSPKCWPEFDQQDFHIALIDYARRNRRFGRFKSLSRECSAHACLFLLF